MIHHTQNVEMETYHTMKKKLLLTILSCLLLLSLGLLTACDGDSTPADTTAEDAPAPSETADEGSEDPEGDATDADPNAGAD